MHDSVETRQLTEEEIREILGQLEVEANELVALQVRLNALFEKKLIEALAAKLKARPTP